MRPWRVIVAIFVGALVGCVVMVWPVRPVWTGKTEVPCRLLGFNSDGREVMTSHSPGSGLSYACRWDVGTGRLLKRVEFPDLKDTRGQDHYYLRDDRESVSAALGFNEDVTWYVLDLHTGLRIAGPFEGKSSRDVLAATSRDGRWLCLLRRVEEGEGYVIELHSSESGLVHRWSAERDPYPMSIKVTHDGNRAAVLWANMRKGSSRPTDQPVRVTVHELPSCREVKRFETPPCGHAAVQTWDEAALDIVTLSWPVMGQDPVSKIYRFPLDQPVVQPEPLDPMLSSHNDGPLNFRVMGYGHEWVAYFSILPLDQAFPVWEKWYDWAVEKLGGSPKANPAPRGVIRVRDLRTGRFRQSLPPRVTIDVRLSPDGQYLASSLEGGGIALWDIDPVPRWMKAAPAGIGTFALLLAWSWCRRRGKANVGTPA